MRSLPSEDVTTDLGGFQYLKTLRLTVGKNRLTRTSRPTLFPQADVGVEVLSAPPQPCMQPPTDPSVSCAS